MLAFRVDFLSRVYHAADPAAPFAPEWPPAPDRLFQALVAGAYGGGLDPSPLRALEGSAPEIVYPGALVAQSGTNYVPAAYKAKQGRVSKYDPAMVGIVDPVFFLWPDIEEERIAQFRDIAANVDYLGRAKSPVAISIVSDIPALPHRLSPAAEGDLLLRIPHAGRLDELDAAFAAGRRANVSGMAAYREVTDDVVPSPWGELLALRPKRDLYIGRAAQLADAIRAATLSVLGDDARPVVHGHDGDHAAWVAIPDVAHPYAKGHILGLGAWLPRHINSAVRDECAVALMHVSHVMSNGHRVPVELQRAHQQSPVGLRASTWGRASTQWATVTPMVLDRHPKRGQSLGTVIADSVEFAGYPRPVDVDAGQGSIFTGVPSARAFRPRRPGRWTHAALAFERPIRGPLLVGRERHFGMGLFRPVATTHGR